MGLNRNTSNEKGPGRPIRGVWEFLALRVRRNPKRVFVINGAIALALAFPLAVHATDGYCSQACGVVIVLPQAGVLEIFAEMGSIVQ